MSKTPKYVVLNKERGETPLEAILKWKSEHLEFANVASSYAGRLDPMAEGKLLVLLGEECKKQDEYVKLDKEYEVEVLLGMKTDTGDVLGIPVAQKDANSNKFLNTNETYSNSHLPATSKYSQKQIRAEIKKELGPHSRKYPAFSSKTVSGKPLFLYALEGTLGTVVIPEHIEHIYSIQLLGTEKVPSSELQTRITQSLAKVPRSDESSKLLGADFRQDAVRAEWQKVFSEIPASREFTILRLRVLCGSGSYMRTLAERIGASLGTPALALSIKRTKLGKCVPFGPLSFWSRQY
jgi:tRNA U55 pseudouridine synthase TruB